MLALLEEGGSIFWGEDVMTTNWKRAAVGACTATALVVGAGLAFAPAANAAGPTTGLLGGVTTGVTGVVSGVLGGVVTGTPTSTSPTPIVTVTSSPSGVGVGVGTTTVGVTTGNGVGVTLGTGGGSGAGATLGGTSTGAAGTVTVSGGSPDPSSSASPTPDPSTAAPVVLTALSATSQYDTVYPAKDGYRDTDTFTLHGTVSDGQQHLATGTATLTLGSSTVTTWPITATDQVITWNGLRDGRIVPGRYTFTATIGDSSGHSVSGVTRVDVSAKKLKSATSLLSAKSVSGTHRMSAKPLAGLSKGRVTLRITSVASHVRGKQYLVFTHRGKHLRVLIRNGKHTSKSITIPKSFTSFTISHTWKKGTVRIRSLQYRYAYKALG